MEDIALRASKNVDRTEADLTRLLSQPEIKHETLEPVLAKFRSACQDFIFLDFRAAVRAQVEERLWTAHSKVNSKFRPYLAQFRDGEGQKRKVERRKAEKIYLLFIKSSQSFYRGYIQRLASNFKDVPEILSVAHGMGLDALSADNPLEVDYELKRRLVNSCYSALVQCGDLSRYRETELSSNSRNWGPAVGYYSKAAVLDPTDGKAYHQLAVVALSDRDHLRGVYHLYQAICVETPFPQAQGNLELEFKKLRRRAKEGKPVADNVLVLTGNRYLYEQFLLLHARLLDNNATDQEEQESEILRLLTDEIRETPEATILRKFSLINIAAEKSAAEKVSATDPSAIRSFQMLQSFNVKTFSILLNNLLDELQQLAVNEGTASNNSPPEIPPMTRRILSHLRLYSGWLLSTVPFLLANVSMASRMQQLWQLYAKVLNLLIRLFPFNGADIQYLLKEDEETLAFSAFSAFVRENRFCVGTGGFKPVYSESAFGLRVSNSEMLFRIKGIIRDGVFLLRANEFKSLSIPLGFSSKQFIYLGESGSCSKVEGRAVSMPAGALSGEQGGVLGDIDQNLTRNGGSITKVTNQHETVSNSKVSMASRMESMVDDLTGSGAPKPASKRSSLAQDPAATAMTSPVAQAFDERRTSPSQAFPPNAQDLVQRMQQRSSVPQPSPKAQAINIASLPSIYRTPFAPRPGETPESPRPSTAHRTLQAPFAPEDIDSSAAFQANLAHLADEIQQRTSPQSSFRPTLSEPHDWVQGSANHAELPSSPWRPHFGSAVLAQQIPISTRPPPASPYGAIGESRPKSSRTPNNGQPG